MTNTDKKVVLDKTTLSIYPRNKILAIYGLLGGAIGGLIYSSSITMLFLVEGDLSLQELPDVIKMLLALVFFGFSIGLLPALLAGFVIGRLQICFDSIKKIVPLFVIGFISTFIFMIWFALDENAITFTTSILSFCCIGGISAVITGWFALPKLK